MSLGLAFWVLFIVAAVFGWPGNTWLGGRGPLVSWGVGFILLGILGWQVFGPAIRG